jgi:hypothetical protein
MDMRKSIFITAAVIAVFFVSSARAQSCNGQAKLVRAACLGGESTLLCLCDQWNRSCRWQWACDKNGQSPRMRGLDSSIPLREQVPDYTLDYGAAAEAARRRAEAQRIQQETELLRQQTEALRQQNEARTREQSPIERHQTEALRQQPELGIALTTMPDATQDAQIDEKNWNQWRAKL